MLKQYRVVIEQVTPQLNCDQFFIKRVVNETVTVSAQVLADGHDVIRSVLQFKHEKSKKWNEISMQEVAQDRYGATFRVEKQGFYEYRVQGWVDYALNWQHGIEAKLKDGQHVKSELLDGVQHLETIMHDASPQERKFLEQAITEFQNDNDYDSACAKATSAQLHELFFKYPTKFLANTSETLQVYVDRKKAAFSTWYEFFPRSAAEEEGKHGTFKDCERLLPRVAAMGFDTLYFPPIHPIGEKNRKGKNNATNAQEGDTGVPWAIGSKHGGHKSIHPELGSEADFKALIKKAEDHGIEIAMDIAFQAAPDHPYISSHPEWFRKRPDGTMQYAENPPKKYQDIVNFYYETAEYKSLFKELLSIVEYWIGFGVNVFRVDNPHTKPFLFWNWLIEQIKKKHPDVLFLAEAFSRPAMMQQLAKQGYTMSYTYFTWRTTKHELIEYMTELTQTEQREYFRPNFWPNTPDINPYHMQGANEAMHLLRYALAATLSGNIGLYGPVYEYMVTEAVPGKEEYMHSEKYQIRHWDWTVENKITHVISKINQLRKEHEALQQTNNIQFCGLENDNLIAYYKWNEDRSDELLIIVSLDPYYPQRGHVQLPLADLQLHPGQQVTVRDLVTGSSYNWRDEWNYVELHPTLPFHIFKILK
ncbi:alpha-1,4-glucan--maltose-1-phosphate maltosyltransferase [Croceiramulus getboli]|nr:alpha-1,4-glucan--maltose-1-phosphate maltosyltransferase [Flavobacteriaceae bacterium YJPT1-3]